MCLLNMNEPMPVVVDFGSNPDRIELPLLKRPMQSEKAFRAVRFAYLHRTMTAAQIARETGEPYGVVWNTLQSLGIFRKGFTKRLMDTSMRKITIATQHTLTEELRAGRWQNMTEAAKHYGISRERVRQIARRAGIAGYERALSGEEVARRDAVANAVRDEKRAKRDARRRVAAEKIAALWNDPALTTAQVGERLEVKLVAQRAAIFRRWFPEMFPHRHKIAQALRGHRGGCGGVFAGERGPKRDNAERIAALWNDGSCTVDEAAKAANMTLGALYNAVRIYGKTWPELFIKPRPVAAGK